jgi:hypothetical protein
MGHYKDIDYDHIVVMTGYDATGVFFNDLHANSTLRYNVSDFAQSRQACDDRSKPKPNMRYCLPPAVDYGIRVHGTADLDGVLLPAQLHMDSWREPDYSEEDGLHEKPIELRGTLTVNQLQPGTRYTLLRYEDAASVPNRNFLTSNFTSRQDFVSPAAGKAEFATRFMSNSTIFFRCVRVPQDSDIRRLSM